MQQIVNILILNQMFCRRASFYSVLCTITWAIMPRTFSVLQSCIPGQKTVICDYENAAAQAHRTQGAVMKTEVL